MSPQVTVKNLQYFSNIRRTFGMKNGLVRFGVILSFSLLIAWMVI